MSLMQTVKTSVASKRHHDVGQLFISVLTDSTTDRVTASFAILGDIILAEPHILIRFAGPRVIEQTTGQKLPEGLQCSEFLLGHGSVDKTVERKDQKRVTGQVLYTYHSHKVDIQIPMDRDYVGMGRSMENSGDSGKAA